MPVQSEYYSKVKPVCDHLAVLASQCHEKEFYQRLDFLEALCKSWAQPDEQQESTLAASTGGVAQANDTEVCQDSSSEPYQVHTLTYREENVSFVDQERLRTENCSKEQSSESETGAYHYYIL